MHLRFSAMFSGSLLGSLVFGGVSGDGKEVGEKDFTALSTSRLIKASRDELP